MFPIPFRWTIHNRNWKVWKCRTSKAYFIEDDLGALVGPYSSPVDAYDWIKEIRFV